MGRKARRARYNYILTHSPKCFSPNKRIVFNRPPTIEGPDSSILFDASSWAVDESLRLPDI